MPCQLHGISILLLILLQYSVQAIEKVPARQRPKSCRAMASYQFFRPDNKSE